MCARRRRCARASLLVNAVSDTTGDRFTGIPWIGVGNNPCDASFNRRWFPGDMDELRFYDRVLSSGEIAQLESTVAVPTLSARDVLLLVMLLRVTGLVAARRM